MATSEDLDSLNQGEAVWRKWRDTHPDVRPDFRGADLRRRMLRGLDLSGADFSGADLRDANLRRADLSNARLNGARLYRVLLSGTKLRGPASKEACCTKRYSRTWTFPRLSGCGSASTRDQAFSTIEHFGDRAGCPATFFEAAVCRTTSSLR